ncbi:hypothetical protein Tsubulata_011432 [Turnera subulata]|uniref:Helicase ATP-binding domain-containing protein n=1 Tax=Turnera subulata TaxID=218843 RepID=A0A9Q0JG28_9ROSI|nr:hypothetical protein Tsubulata_011432 [Turnera subulata]
MSSAIPHQIIDEDDDEFDWEAAVREIDVACENANNNPSSSNLATTHFAPRQNGAGSGGAFSVNENCRKKFGSCKQSTLDRFIGKVGRAGMQPKIPGSGRVECKDDGAVLGGDEGLMSCIDIDTEAAKTWIYPVNVPLRDYQLAITKTALFSNTLVALPTGLGKTLIAAVVMFNYFRWFPEGKIVFAAPSRPLVMQQIEACHNIVGIPQEWTIDMTGQINPTKRSFFWKSKRVFFVTPQVLEKDIQAGTCLVRHLVCLVIDEAHRALGNYSYSVAVRELMAMPVPLRILALTATPGSKQQTIQSIIDNLHISTLEYRNESDPDVIPYVHNRKIELIEVPLGKDAIDVNKLLLEVIHPYVTRLSSAGLLQNRDYQTLSPPDLLNSRDKFRRAPPPDLPHNRYGEIEAYFGALITLYHIRKLLSSHGIKPAFEMLEEKLKQGDIMSALADIGNLVKATEFIGQSSGKSLKGQSQKVQQAVLQKFRAGGYNVIVATSIGEEGPLVLACEGSELKGYMRKQANSRAIRKHMHNGGISSFNFHASPRMIPHIFKPEVQFVELSIDQYVPRGKKVKEDSTDQTPVFEENITTEEAALISKYFNPDNTWAPSLIAFPRFQAFPSRVHKVMHSCRTTMLIDSMQHLQALSSMKDSTAFSFEFQNEVTSGQCLGVNPDEYKDNDGQASEYEGNDEEPIILDNFPRTESLNKITDVGVSPTKTVITDKRDFAVNFHEQTLHAHSYLFGSDCVSVDALGRVLIMSVPSLSLKHASGSDCPKASTALPPNSFNPNLYNLTTSGEDYGESTMQGKVMLDPEPSEIQCIKNVTLAREEILDQIESIHKSPISTNLSNKADHPDNVLDRLVTKTSSQQDDFCNSDTDLSPRLTNMIQSGIVPESPVSDNGKSNRNEIVEAMVPDILSKTCADLTTKSLNQRESKTSLNNRTSQTKFSVSPSEKGVGTPLLKRDKIARLGKHVVVSPVSEQCNSPFANVTKSSCSNDSALSSGDKSGSVQEVRKFKRLRKVGEIETRAKRKTKKENSLAPNNNFDKPFSSENRDHVEFVEGKKKRVGNVGVFLEVEAEVSSEAEISDDEEDEPGNSSYEDSFIDDRIHPTASSSQAEASTSRVDMMAVYRRSLLSQSPMVRESSSYATYTPDCGVSTSRKNESGNSSVKTLHSLHAPHDPGNHSAGRLSKSLQTIPERIALTPCTTSDFPIENETKLENRKRKLSFIQSDSLPVINLDQEFYSQPEPSKKEALPQGVGDPFDTDQMFFDDQFFATLDLDAVEAQAASLLKNKSDLPVQKHEIFPNSNLQSVDLQNSPTFDLGI